MTDQQLLRGVAGSVDFTLYDSDGDADDTSSGVTLGVTRADGTTLVSAGTAATDGGTDEPGVWRHALTAAQLEDLDQLTATWADSAGNTADVTTHDVVGGFYFTPAELKAQEPAGKPYDGDQIKRARRRVEEDIERICDVAFVPRYARERLDGTGTSRLLLPHAKVRTVRTVRVYSDETTYTSFTADELAALEVTEPLGIEVIRTDGNTWTSGRKNLVVEYEHGFGRPPQSVKEAAIRYARHVLGEQKTGLSQRFVLQEGSTIGLARPDAWHTGLDDVDSVLARYSLRAPGYA